jgi:hypothetical protein
MGSIPPTTAAEKSFIAGPAFVDFTQETASTDQFAPDSVAPQSATGSQVLQSIYDGESLLGTLNALASASPSMAAWAAQEEKTISQQIAHEFGLLIAGSTFPLFPISPGQGTSSDSIQGMLNLLQSNPTSSNLNTAMSSVMAAIEQADPGDPNLQQEGSSLQATLSAYLNNPSSQNHQALLAAQMAFDQTLSNDGISMQTFSGGSIQDFEGAIDDIISLA